MGSGEPTQPGKDLSLARLEAALAKRDRPALDLGEHRRSAVLVPLFFRAGELTLVFTVRSAGLRSHSGQISFPGGRVDAEDAHPTATALREAQEEIGVDPASATILGMLSDIKTGTGYLITPVVARLDPAPPVYSPNPTEVAEVFEVAVRRLRQPGAYYAYQVDDRKIWGATGRIVHDLLELL